MKPRIANLINGLLLLLLGVWAFIENYFQTDGNPSKTGMIPIFFGIIFLMAVPKFKPANRMVMQLITALTVLLFLSLFMPLSIRISKGDPLGSIRVGLMVLSCLFASIVYIKYFVDVKNGLIEEKN